jgi:hypothetical protein
LDISQAFDRVWHEVLLNKNLKISANTILLVYQFIPGKQTLFCEAGERSNAIIRIHAAVPQGSVMGPTLYLLYTADLPTSEATLTGTFADHTAVLSIDEIPENAAQKLQNSHLKMDQRLAYQSK